MNDKPSREHQQAIIAALEAVKDAVRVFAEARYPGDQLRQDCYSVIVCEDAGIAAKFGAQLGLGLSQVVAQVRQLATELP